MFPKFLSFCNLFFERPNKEIEVPNITKKWTINDISIEGVMESLMKHVDELANNLRKNSMDILAQLQRRKDVLVTQIRSELDSAHSAVKRIQEQAETEQDEHKMTLKVRLLFILV